MPKTIVEKSGEFFDRIEKDLNKKSHAKIDLGFGFREAYICDILENNLEKLESDGNSVELDIANFEIVTLKFVV